MQNTSGNRFDAIPASSAPAASSSADTSVASVATEAHHVSANVPEVSTRRRVSPMAVDCTPAAAPVECSVRPKQNNPYMYNVLGEHASADFAARTSPIPGVPLSPVRVPMSYEVPSPPSAAFSPGHHAPATAAVLGGYMAACYSSAFPPGHLPTLQPAEIPAAASTGEDAAAAGSTRRRGRRPPPPAQTEEVSPRSHTSSISPTGSRSPVSPTTTGGSPTMARAYRNGRPVPVLAAASKAAAQQ